MHPHTNTPRCITNTNITITKFGVVFIVTKQHNMNHIKNEIEQEYEIIKYALTFLLSNLNEDIIKDMSDYIEDTDKEEVESLLQTTIDNY